jgi:hypothetical protein
VPKCLNAAKVVGDLRSVKKFRARTSKWPTVLATMKTAGGNSGQPQASVTAPNAPFVSPVPDSASDSDAEDDSLTEGDGRSCAGQKGEPRKKTTKTLGLNTPTDSLVETQQGGVGAARLPGVVKPARAEYGHLMLFQHDCPAHMVGGPFCDV